MKWLKRSITYLWIGLALYVVLTVGVDAVLNLNRSKLEAFAAETLGVREVKFGRFYNLPFLNLSARRVRLSDPAYGSLELDRIKIHYRPLKLLGSIGPALISSVQLDHVDAELVEQSFSNLQQRLSSATNGSQSNSIKIPDFKMKVRVRDFRFALASDAVYRIDFKSDETLFQLNGKEWNFQSGLNAESRISNVGGLLSMNAFAKLQGKLDRQRFLTGEVVVSNLSIVGIPLFTGQKILLNLDSNQVHLKSEDADGRQWLSMVEDGAQIDYTETFSLNYRKFYEQEIMERVFESGDYRVSLKGKVHPENARLMLEVQPQNAASGDKNISVTFQWPDLHAELHAKSSKFGELNFRLDSVSDAPFPNISLGMRRALLFQGFHFGGDFRLVPSGGNLLLSGEDVSINGGNLGSLRSKILLTPEGLRFLRPSEEANVLLSGEIQGDTFQVDLGLSEVYGAAVVSNIGLDFMGIGKRYLFGNVRLQSGVRLVDADLQAYTRLWGGKLKSFATVQLWFETNRLYFEHFTIPSSDMVFKGAFDFEFPNPVTNYIHFNGSCFYSRRFLIPATGEINLFMDKKKSDIEFVLDSNIRLTVNNEPDFYKMNLTADHYNLERMGFLGSVNGRFGFGVRKALLDWVDSDVNYTLMGRPFRLNVKAVRQGDELPFRAMMLDTGEDKLIGSGSLKQLGERLIGKVDFVRGGEIAFSSSFENMSGMLDLRNIFIKDFISPSQDVFLSLKMSLFGPLLLPNFTSSIRVTHSSSSSPLSLDIPYFSKNQNIYEINSARLTMPGVNLNANARMEMIWGGLVLSLAGNGKAFDLFQGGAEVYYTQQTNAQQCRYKFREMYLGKKPLPSISGNIYGFKNRWRFEKTSEFGINGLWSVRGSNRDWDLEWMLSRDLKGSFSGQVKDQYLSGALELQSPLDLLALLPGIQDPSGNVRVNVKMNGPLASPELNGSIKVNDAYLGIAGLNSRLQKLNLNLQLEKNRVFFQNQDVTTSEGDFVLNGWLDLVTLSDPLFNLELKAKGRRPQALSIEYNHPAFSFSSDLVIRQLNASGRFSAMNVGGDISAENTEVQLRSLQMVIPQESGGSSDLLNNIRWNLPLKVGGNFRFSTELTELYFRRDETLQIGGSFGDNSFTLKGDLIVERGTFNYLGKDFTVKEGIARFGGGIEPYVNLTTTMSQVDSKGEDIDIYLTFDGKLSKIKMSDFYSVPSRSRSELASILGLRVDTGTVDPQAVSGSGDISRNLIISGVGMLENNWFLSPIAVDMRRKLGLDLLNIKTDFFENWAKNAMIGNTNISMLDLWEGSGLVVGKYLVPNLFLQYEFSIAENPLKEGELLPVHTIGIELDLNPFDIGWKYQPFSESGKQLRYEQKFELNINLRQ